MPTNRSSLIFDLNQFYNLYLKVQSNTNSYNLYKNKLCLWHNQKNYKNGNQLSKMFLMRSVR
jgi:hypothetical protein